MTNNSSSRAHPAWVEEIREKYLAGEASIFVLYGNVFDKVFRGSNSWMVNDYLVSELFDRSKHAVYDLSLSQGLRLVGGVQKTVLAKELKSIEVSPSNLFGGLADALRSVEGVFYKNSTALLIPYANSMLPATDMPLMSPDERAALTTVHRWSLDDRLAKRDCVVVLLCESLQQINPSLLSSPRVAAIEVPLPDMDARSVVVRAASSSLSNADAELISRHTAGLRAIQIEGLLSSPIPTALDENQRYEIIFKLMEGQKDAASRARQMAAITAGKTRSEIIELVAPDARVEEQKASGTSELVRVINERKREIIEKECAGLLSFMDSKYGLEAVGGNEQLKAELMGIAQLIKSGNRRLAPMGLLGVGPMGAGKTFVVKAFLKEAGLTGVALKNIRSKWQGSTEANLERVLSTVKAMGPIAVVIDESDRSFGNKDAADTDGGVSARVMARLKEFMSDTENRGQVLFILMTNRPDRIETDLKRPGRLDRKVPFFYCQTAEERADVLRAILRRDGSEKLPNKGLVKLCQDLENYSNADLEAVALLALDFAARAEKPLAISHIQQAVEDFIPSREEDMLQLMELLAVQETSRRSLLPERFAKMSTREINEKVNFLKRRLREEG